MLTGCAAFVRIRAFPALKSGEAGTTYIHHKFRKDPMTRTRTSALLVALVVLVAAAAGCGSSSSSSGSGSTTIAKGGANGETPSTGKVQGGNARFNLASDTDFVDPALAYY